MTDLIERLQHCSANTTDAYLHELTGRAADRIRELEAYVEELENEMPSIAGAVGASMYGKRIRELEQLVDDCRPYLKRHETPAQCIQRNRDDAGRALKMLVEEKRIVERVRELLHDCDVYVCRPDDGNRLHLITPELEEALNDD